MSDIDLDGLVEGVAEVIGTDGCANIFIAGFNWFPVPTLLTAGSVIAHATQAESAPVFHGLQDAAAFYAGALVTVGFMKLANIENTFRNNLIATVVGCSLFAASAFGENNYFEKAFGKDDKKTKTEQTAPKTDTTAKKPAPANW